MTRQPAPWDLHKDREDDLWEQKWDESAHPRAPAGQSDGGQFVGRNSSGLRPRAGPPDLGRTPLPPPPPSVTAAEQMKQLIERDRARLVAAQDAAMDNPAFQPGGGITHCNQATYAIAKTLGVPLAPFTEPGGGPALASKIATNLAGSKDYVVVGDKQQAQKLANQGVPVFVSYDGHYGKETVGHIASLRPDNVPGDPFQSARDNPLVANVGEENGVMRMSKAVSGKKKEHVKYYTPKWFFGIK